MFPEGLGRRDLPDSHHVARYCRRRDIGSDGVPLETAFYLRTAEEYLSTNWLEYFHDTDRRLQIDGVAQVLLDKGFGVRRTASFAVLNVGAAISACREYLNLDIQFVTLGESHDPSHAGIYGHADRHNAVAAMLAALVSPDEVYPAG